MNISTIAALALSLGLPAWSQQPVTKIVRENGQPTLALDEGFVRGLKQESSIHKAVGAPPPALWRLHICRCRRTLGWCGRGGGGIV